MLFRFLFLIGISCVYPSFLIAQNCVTSSSYTMTPPPVGSQYQTGQTVQICATFTFSQSGAIWVHGIVPVIPAGWNISTLQVTPPNSCSGSGTWGWYNSVTGTAGSAGTHGPGIFYNQGFDTNPGNNFGDNCLGSFSFCITLTTSADCGGGALNGSNLNVSFQILGDNLSGSWTNSSCGISVINPPPALNSTLNCCTSQDVTVSLCNPGPAVSLLSFLNSPTPGGSWLNPSGTGTSATFTPGVSPEGIYTYNVNIPGCISTSTVNVSTQTAPTAGTAGNVTVCNVSPAFNLNDYLTGESAGGNWTGPGNVAVSNIFTPGSSNPGNYTYTVGDGVICPISQSVVSVTILSLPNAGTNTQYSVCETEPAFDLFSVLNGNPDVGGSWSDPFGNTFSGTFSPGTTIDGIYTYSIGDAPCVNSATLEITTVSLPFAGNNTLVDICTIGQSVNLFGLLTGADSGGSWTNPSGNSFSGIFDPQTDLAGNYTYQLGSGNCSDQSVVTVTLTTPPSAVLNAPTDVCGGEEFDISFDITGNGPFNLIYSISGTEYLLSNISSGQTESITLNQSETISIVSVVSTADVVCVGGGNSTLVNIQPTPTASISGGGGICTGSTASLTFNFTGTGPFNAVYTDGSQNFDLVGVNDGHTVNVSPNVNTTYTLITMSDSGTLQCTGTVSGSANFTITDEPQASISGTTSICLGETTDLVFNITGTGPFDVVYTDGVTNYTLTNINDGHTVSVSPQFLTNYQLVSVAVSSNVTCTGSITGNAQITVSAGPQLENIEFDCTPTNENYLVTFDIVGGNPQAYTVSGGGTLSGNQFVSNLINTGGNYNFSISDGSACPEIILSGLHTCDCFTNAGTLVPDDLSVCAGQSAQVFPNNDELLDANDIFVFVLHNGTATTLGSILSTSAIPSLQFQVGMSYGTTYYISAVAGNSDGLGGVNTNDPCLSISNGVPVVFIQPPSATISGNLTLCSGETGSVSVNLTGTGPWSFNWALNGAQQGIITTATQPYNLEVNAAGTYTITSVSDDNCTGTTQGASVVTINALPTASISGNLNLCAGTVGGPSVVLTGGGPWTIEYSINGGATTNQIINSSPFTLQATQAGTYTLISVSNNNCIGTVSGQATVNIQPLPSATISGGGFVCQGDDGQFEITGNGTGTTSVTYAINGNNAGTVQLQGGIATFSSSIPGIYSILQVADEFCTAPGGNSQATLTVNPIPSAILNVSTNSLCEGDSALISINFTGNGPFDLSYLQGGQNTVLNDVNSVSNYLVPYNGMEITLLSVSDNSNPTCNQSLNQSVVFQVLPSPQPPILTDVFRCMFDEFTNIGTTPVSGLSYSWIPTTGLSNPSISNPQFQLITNSSIVQTYPYTLSVSNGICTVQSTMNVQVDPGPLVGFNYSPNPVTTENTQVNFQNTTPGINEYLWTVNELYEFTNAHISFNFPDGIEGEYPVTLVATDLTTGCTREITQIIAVKGELLVYVPNSFTPNGDGINDLFGPVMRNFSEEDFSFSIINRQGELVFSTNNTQLKWDGAEPAREYYAQDAVYLWIILVKDKNTLRTSEFRGTVTLLR